MLCPLIIVTSQIVTFPKIVPPFLPSQKCPYFGRGGFREKITWIFFKHWAKKNIFYYFWNVVLLPRIYTFDAKFFNRPNSCISQNSDTFFGFTKMSLFWVRMSLFWVRILGSKKMIRKFQMAHFVRSRDLGFLSWTIFSFWINKIRGTKYGS